MTCWCLRVTAPVLGLTVVLGFASWVPAASAVDFTGKTISMIIGSAPGGGTDSAGRLIAPFLEKYLPGKPKVVVRNMPGAQGVTAMTYVVQQTKPDGLTVMTASSSQVNPLVIQQVKSGGYDPTKFHYVGGVGRGGVVLMINKTAEKRLYDKSSPPVILGAVDGTRSNEMATLWGVEYLGWNVKWVIGYRGTNNSALALERHEIDMLTTGTLSLIKRLEESGEFDILMQTGSLEDGKYVTRPEFGNAPLFQKLMEGKIVDPVGLQAYRHWESYNSIDKWSALTEKTPKDIVAAYREAFAKMFKDPQFIERGTKVSEDLTPMDYRTVSNLVKQLAENTTPAVEQFIKSLQRKQGINVKK